MKYPAYPKYKPSGIEWLGEVPEGWDVKRLKLSVRLDDCKVEADEDNPLPYIGLENIESWTGRLFPVDSEAKPTGTANYFDRKNTLFGKLRPYLAKAYNPEFDGLCSTELLVLEATAYNKNELLYLLLSDGFIKLVNAATFGVKMPRADWEFIGNCRLPLPPPPTQTAIASFLDRETGRIDTLVAKNHELTERLKEQRVALITRTVTRGLPADAAREFGVKHHTRFKDSGIAWLGEVPEGWELKPLKRLFNVLNGATPRSSEPEYWDGDIPWVTPEDLGNLLSSIIKETKRCITQAGYDSCGTNLAPAGSLVLSTRAPIGHLAITTVSICANQGCRILVPDRKTDVKFYYYVICASRQELTSLGQGSTFLELGKSTLESIKLPVCEIREQKAIASYLDRESAKLDKLVEKVENTIERLQEYRTALITAAVTGKIDVREAK
jgi:type I restriction enzyme S subunit